ncbi:hypothetical protein TPY_2748 [Sulfobacillus acidophilus TPY]|nr:hypothetical protein TPY_2748 [Sulfobacillus acidophilus TPY]
MFDTHYSVPVDPNGRPRKQDEQGSLLDPDVQDLRDQSD